MTASSPAAIVALAPARYKVQFTASKELQEKLERLRDLMRSKVPDGDLAAIIEEAVTEKLERLEPRRFGATKARLEYHHRHPFAFGGKTVPDNLVMLCPAHHSLQTEHDYGSLGRARKRDRGGHAEPFAEPS